jgi:hypothetical protein
MTPQEPLYPLRDDALAGGVRAAGLTRHDKTLAFSLCASALDGEEQAAAAYQRAVAYVAK